MATHLDLEEQEQLDELKHFWTRWGDLITWVLIAVLGAYAAWNGWQYWQRQQAAQAAVLFDTVERALGQSDTALLDRSLGDIRDQFGGTTYAHQAALLAARVYADKGNADKAQAALQWVVDKADDPAYKALARLRLAAFALDQKAYDQAKAALAGTFPREFQALVDDRLGDIAMSQNQAEQAKTHYLAAWTAMDERADYRQVLDMKLAALGVKPSAQGAAK